MISEILLDSFTLLNIFCTLAAFGIPYIIHKVNQQFHKYGDPPWKKQDGKR